ncbi:MAG: sigma 54-interacting transcriptional regulator [Myxococcota bacterium]
MTTMPLASPEGDLGPRLLILEQGDVRAVALPAGGSLSIGRADDADVRIDQDSISRRHAVIHIGEAVEVEDVGSSNGTKVGGQKLERGVRVAVEAGDLIEFGGVSVVVQGALVEGVRQGKKSAMRRLSDVAERVARSEISVLLTGETGVGKEVFARKIHDLSPRSGPFVALNCGALSQQLLESELFGHEAGAFTGAKQTKPGLLETGEGGTVFLDEVGEMPLDAQVRLLRVLEERRVLRVGGLQPRPIDVRFVSATNRDLQQEVAAGRFREDLYYRLNGITLAIPPLRERLAEVPKLASTFIDEAAARSGMDAPSLSAAALSRLEAHPWPGNIRELRNVVERAVVLCGDGPIEAEHLFPEDLVGGISGNAGGAPTDERGRIVAALQECAGNQTRAAKLLGISRKTLGVKMDAYGIARPQKGRTR